MKDRCGRLRQQIEKQPRAKERWGRRKTWRIHQCAHGKSPMPKDHVNHQSLWSPGRKNQIEPKRQYKMKSWYAKWSSSHAFVHGFSPARTKDPH